MRHARHGKRFYQILTGPGPCALAIGAQCPKLSGMSKLAFVSSLLLFLVIGTQLPGAELGEKLEEAGTRIQLPEGQYLQLTVEEMKVVGRFTDSEGLLIEPVAESIVIIVDQPGHKNDEWRTVIHPTGENSMSSSRLLRGPYSFRARIILRHPDGTTKTYPYQPLELDKGVE